MKIVAIIALLLLAVIGSTLLYAQMSLSRIEENIASQHPVEHLVVADVSQSISGTDSTKFLIFDTRPEDEFTVGHIANAIQVNPDISAAEFIKTFAADVQGKHLLFYCSVGKRSSILVERVEEDALEAGALSLANIRGGIFRWYNEGYSVVNAEGETDEIHPYDRFWGKLVQKRSSGK